MTMYFSPKNMAFYSDELFTIDKMPKDVIEITDEQHITMLENLNLNQKGIQVDKSGNIKYYDKQPAPETWDTIKGKRNKLLAQSDYTQMADWPGDKAAWAVYRQALRDLTDTFENAEDVVWPVKPE